MSDPPRPDGVESRNEAAGRGPAAGLVGLAALAVLLVAAVSGAFGTERVRTVEADGTRLSVAGPARIRGGEIFEMLFTVESGGGIRDAVLRIDERVWRDVTLNTVMPQPTEETFADGAFELRFGPLPAGSRLVVKVDGQVNPLLPSALNDGAIELADGDTALVAVHYAMRILP